MTVDSAERRYWSQSGNAACKCDEIALTSTILKGEVSNGSLYLYNCVALVIAEISKIFRKMKALIVIIKGQ